VAFKAEKHTEGGGLVGVILDDQHALRTHAAS
jgi:hypothetical protein